VILMWPLADRLTRWLQQRFRAREEDEAQPRYLDDNVLVVPALALDALEREVARFGQLCVRIAGAVLTGAAPVALVGDRTAMTQLDAAVESFAERLSRSALSKVTSERLAELLRIHRYYKTCADQAQTAAPLQTPEDPALAAHQQAFVMTLQQLFTQQDAGSGANGDASVVDVVPMELAYQNLKAAVLVSAAAGALPLARMETALGQYSALRRAAQQAAKAREHLHRRHTA
jgi:phosphate:Na+ symporter